MTITAANELSSAPNFVRGQFTSVAGSSNTAAVPTAGFNTMIYTTDVDLATLSIKLQMIDEDGVAHDIPEITGFHKRVGNSATTRVGYITALPASFRFRNLSAQTVTIYYEMRKSATHDRGV